MIIASLLQMKNMKLAQSQKIFILTSFHRAHNYKFELEISKIICKKENDKKKCLKLLIFGRTLNFLLQTAHFTIIYLVQKIGFHNIFTLDRLNTKYKYNQGNPQIISTENTHKHIVIYFTSLFKHVLYVANVNSCFQQILVQRWGLLLTYL